MATLERTYNVPLRKGFYKAPKYRKTKKAMITLREFLVKHMKCAAENLKIGRKLNELLWERGYKYPPHHVKLTAIKTDDGIVKAELFGFKYEEPIKSAEKEEKATKGKKETEKEVKDLKEELDKVVDVKKIEDTETKPEKKEKKPRVKKETLPKEENVVAAEEKPKKERKPRVKKAAEEKAE